MHTLLRKLLILQDFDVSSEGPSSRISRRRAFARNVKVLFIAWVVSRSFDTFASCDNVVRNGLGQACYTAGS